MSPYDVIYGCPSKAGIASLDPITPDGVSQRHTLHLIASHFYMNEENEVSFHEFLI